MALRLRDAAASLSCDRVALMALGLWRGQADGCLPGRVARLHLPLVWACRVLHLLANVSSLAGYLGRERWTGLVEAPRRGWMALTVATMGLIIVLPIPLGNLLPAVSLVLLGLGLALLFTTALPFGAWHWGAVALPELGWSPGPP
jgi:hypothetical protein